MVCTMMPHEELPRKSSYTFPQKKSLWRMRRAPRCTDRAQNATALPGRASSVDPVRVCANRARTRIYGRKQTKISPT